MRFTLMLGLAIALVLIGTHAQAAGPDYTKARAYTQRLTAVVDESYSAANDPVKRVARTKELNQLPADAEALFGKKTQHQPFWSCIEASHSARDYWQGQRKLAEARTVDVRSANELARAGFNFGDAYRRCKNEVEALDPTPAKSSGKIIDLTKSAS